MHYDNKSKKNQKNLMYIKNDRKKFYLSKSFEPEKKSDLQKFCIPK